MKTLTQGTLWIVYAVIAIFLIVQPSVVLAQKVKGSSKIAKPAEYKSTFLITIYYTTQESGYTQANGFTPTSSTSITINNQSYMFQSDFVSQVKTEGWGQLTDPNEYLVYLGNGQYGLSAGPPLGNHNNALVAKQTAASDPAKVPLHKSVRVLSATVQANFGNNQFSVEDGGDINGWHLDLYWGIAPPRMGDASVPGGCTYTRENGIKVVNLGHD